MIPTFPVDRAEKRQAFLQAVARVCDILAADAEQSEVLRTLAPASVAALTESGLFAMKCPAELGGAQADPVTHIEVIEATSYVDWLENEGEKFTINDKTAWRPIVISSVQVNRSISRVRLNALSELLLRKSGRQAILQRVRLCSCERLSEVWGRQPAR